MAILTIFLHILAQNFSRWPKILNILCLLTKTDTREQYQSIFTTPELIPFLWERLKLCPIFENSRFSLLWTRDTSPKAWNHIVNFREDLSWCFSIIKSFIRFIPFWLWLKQCSKVKILKWYKKAVKGHNYGQTCLITLGKV